MGQTITSETVEDALARLGSSVSAVKAGLEQMGYKGDHHGSNCPVANYLKDQFNSNFVVGWAKVYEMNEDGSAGKSLATVPVPVGDFVLSFDKGNYPELETFRGRWARKLRLK